MRNTRSAVMKVDEVEAYLANMEEAGWGVRTVATLPRVSMKPELVVVVCEQVGR